jgi:hypothetical protein
MDTLVNIYPSPETFQKGKNKRLTKSKKGGKKKAQDPFLKKEWYSIRVPAYFKQREAGKTLVTKTQGTSKLRLPFPQSLPTPHEFSDRLDVYRHVY